MEWQTIWWNMQILTSRYGSWSTASLLIANVLHRLCSTRQWAFESTVMSISSWDGQGLGANGPNAMVVMFVLSLPFVLKTFLPSIRKDQTLSLGQNVWILTHTSPSFLQETYVIFFFPSINPGFKCHIEIHTQISPQTSESFQNSLKLKPAWGSLS